MTQWPNESEYLFISCKTITFAANGLGIKFFTINFIFDLSAIESRLWMLNWYELLLSRSRINRDI